MSFVQNLRMRNMFPVNSNLGSAKINLSGRDPMREVIDEFRRLQGESQPSNGLQQVASMQRPSIQPTATEQPPLKFGGVIGGSNPGADILARSKNSAEQTYANYGKPLNTQDVSGPSNDEAHMERYFNRQNKETVANAALANAGNRGWKTVNITDPKDPSKTTAVQVNDNTGETRPIELPGQITNKENPAAIQRRLEDKTKQAANLDNLRARTRDQLALMDELMDEKGKIKSTVGDVTGKSRWMGLGWLPEGQGTIAKLNRLQNNLTLDLIKEMKEQSRTGATGFGQLNLRELGVLENAATMLETRGMTDEQYEAELKRIQDRLKLILLDADDKANTGGMDMAVGHGAGTNGTSEKIRVINKATGKPGTMSAKFFNPQKYDRVQ